MSAALTTAGHTITVQSKAALTCAGEAAWCVHAQLLTVISTAYTLIDVRASDAVSIQREAIRAAAREGTRSVGTGLVTGLRQTLVDICERRTQ